MKFHSYCAKEQDFNRSVWIVMKFGAPARTSLFGFQEGYTFINHGSNGAVPIQVQERQKQLTKEMDENPDVFFRDSSIQLWRQARDAAAQFVGAKPDNLVFVQNATTGINTVLKAIPWKDGDEILTSTYTYKAIEKACHRTVYGILGGKIRQLQIQFPIQDEQDIVDSLVSILDSHPKIKLAVLDHITSHTALVLPINPMIEECRRRGVMVLIDGAHAPGQLEINMEDLKPDFYTGNFHKWVYTPRGCAILWINEEHHDWCYPLVTSYNYQQGIFLEYFSQGTRDDVPYFCVPEALKFYRDIGGMEKITQYTRKLLDDASALIAKKLNTETLEIPRFMEPPNMRLIRLPDIKGYPKTLEGTEKLYRDIGKDYKINCVIFPAQNEMYIRISANIYNEMADYEKVADILHLLSQK